METQGTRIRNERESRGWSQEQLAKEITRLFGKKVEQQSIQQLETDKVQRPLFFAELCQVLGVPAKYLRAGQLREIAKSEHPSFMRDGLEDGPCSTDEVPLISWVMAGAADFAVDLLDPGHAEAWLPCNRQHSAHTYALRVEGHSMTAPEGARYSFPHGINIFVDPELRGGVGPGDFVIAKINGLDAVTFKQLAHEDGKVFLRPLNPSYPLIFGTYIHS